jgi:1-acyl-sn-glycerol-3-phosphate acyltransferase
VVVFPEGTRHRERLGEALPGIGFFAARSGCPVVPVGITGTESIGSLLDIRHGYTVKVRFGQVFRVPKGENEAGAELIMANIAQLLPEERRGRYEPAAWGSTAGGSSAPGEA